MLSKRRTFFVLLATLLVPIIPFVVIGELPGERWLAAVEDRDFAFAAVGAGLLTIDVLLPVPSTIVISLLGARLGLVEGWIAAWLGLTIGNAIGYGLGRLWPAKWAPEVSETPAAVTLIMSRPVPILAEAMTLAAGAAREPWITVLVSCALGNAIYSFALAANGALLFASDVGLVAVLFMLLVPAAGWLVWHRSRLTKGRRNKIELLEDEGSR